MYLKRIEIFGFKSFALKTRLEFEPGITAIVGPNGCGKTNIADAIKWALGEQSMRSLRCPRMEDLIFNGSQSRLPLSFAEVSLTFDNQDGLLPVNYSEVTVGRRLYRSGESEYFLNKTQCRLKDIRDIFLDTGLGAQSYSLMEQGKVEFILQAKPEERRSLFEEAAGIAKYKVRKEETLSKLEKVEFDLLRLNDALTLLKEQIRSLDSAVRKTKQYQKYQEELKTYEVVLLLEELKKIENESKILSGESGQILRDYETFSNLVGNIENTLVRNQNELTDIKKKISENQNSIHQIETDLIRAQERIIRAEEKIKESGIQSKIEEEENCSNCEVITNLKKSIEKLTQERTIAIDEKVSLKQKLEEKEKELNEITKITKQETHELAQKRVKIFQIVQEKTQVKNEIVRLETQESNLQNQMKQLHSEVVSLKEKKERITAELDSLEKQLSNLEKEIATFKERKNALTEEIAKKKNIYHNLLDQIQKSQEEFTSCRVRLASLQELMEKTKFSHSAIQTVFSLNLPGVSGPLSSIIKTSAENEKVLEKVLGERLNFLVSETQEAAEKAIRYLRDNKKGWVGFFILEKLPQKLPTLSKLPKARSLLEIIGYESKYENLMRFLFSTVYSDGSAVYSETTIQGGSQSKEPGLLTQQREIGEIQENLSKLETLNMRLASEREKTEKEIINLEGELSKIDLLTGGKQISLAEILKETERKKEESEITQEEIKVGQWEIKEREKEIGEKKQRTEQEERKLKDYETEEKKLSEEIQSLEKNNLTLKEQETTLSRELTELKISLHTSENRLHNLDQEIAKETTEIKNLEKKINQTQEKMVSLSQVLENEKEVLQKEKEKIVSFQESKQNIEATLSQLKEGEQKIEQNISLETGNLNSLKLKFKEVEEKKKNIEISSQKIILEKKHTEMRLKDDFNLTALEAEKKYASQTPGEVSPEEMKMQIEKLKKRIESLGAVNLAAPEEYENLDARLKFLLSQEEDLEKAKQDLHELINRISISTRESFEKTFSQVRENFKNTFHHLFEGGKADLVLTDSVNISETGIEIVAQPAGKKLQNISLLSGGEKALTAIALLFAFFLVRPAPFCLLDEVDATLDDANIYRYLRLVKDFAKETQFIIITHNKRSIEIADLLYGVTMEEFGVSKIISVKFQKAPVPALA